MDHSVQGYLQRLSSGELEVFLRRCMLLDQWYDYDHIVPQMLKLLELRSHPVPQQILNSWEAYQEKKQV